MSKLLIAGLVCLLANTTFAQTDSTSIRRTRTHSRTTRKGTTTTHRTDTTQTHTRRMNIQIPSGDSTKR